jgi:small GTP-binding protein
MSIAPLSFKIVLAGDSSVGKSSIVERLVQDTFRAEATSTCGADFSTYYVPVDSATVRLQIWDTAGQDRFHSVAKSYFRNAVGAILVYDLTSITSFDHATLWLNDLIDLALPNAYILLIGNKSDLEAQREVGNQMVQAFTQKHHLESLETSALTGKGVKEAFARLAFEIYQRVSNHQIIPILQQQPNALQEQSEQKGKCC